MGGPIVQCLLVLWPIDGIISEFLGLSCKIDLFLVSFFCVNLLVCLCPVP